MSRIRTPLLVTGAVALGWVAVQVFHDSHGRAGWLKVEAPRTVVRDRTITVRVTLPPPAPAGLLMAGLHGSTSRLEPLGFLAGGGARSVTAEGGVFDFELAVPARPDVGHVHPVIFTGPTSAWKDRTAAARGEDIPVAEAPADGALYPLKAYEVADAPPVRREEAAWARGVTALLWGLAGVWAWRSGRTRGAAGAGGARRAVRVLALAIFAAGLWEAARADVRLTEPLRQFAREHRLYFERHGLQQGATLAAVAGAAWVGWLALRRVRSPAHSTAAVALAFYAGLALAGLVSQHEVDALLAQPCGPLPLMQWAKLLAALAAAVALRRAGRERVGGA